MDSLAIYSCTKGFNQIKKSNFSEFAKVPGFLED